MYYKAIFARKPVDLEEVRRAHTQAPESFRIQDSITLPEDEWRDFTHHLLKDRAWIRAYNQLANQQGWHGTGTVRDCLLVQNPAGDECLAIDPQGYDYARYVAEPSF